MKLPVQVGCFDLSIIQNDKRFVALRPTASEFKMRDSCRAFPDVDVTHYGPPVDWLARTAASWQPRVQNGGDDQTCSENTNGPQVPRRS